MGSSGGQGGSRSPQATDRQGTSGSTEGKDGGSSLDNLGGLRGPEGQGGPHSQAIPGGQGGPSMEGAVDEVAVATFQGKQTPQTPGTSGDAAPSAVGPESRLLEFTLTVPFRSPLEADMAHRTLATSVQPLEGVVQKEFRVNGSDLVVRWSAEDPDVFRISVNYFLERLSLLIRNIRRIWLPAWPIKRRGK
ncbi:PREDICTED: EKC/KEOPS complex subunit LAGE3-like [Galeopterus variegatus]|uniref:EKC/KEOPS complex subunit LAGE3-like n=1 Tax=Galeopterus variegatus TaxID=482537 RepID=A0ABM0Q3T4_GALVR|nr:PREDICTED: EKC/KEOPS complex subunit LAGE3-like [Galeopterus variegatus]